MRSRVALVVVVLAVLAAAVGIYLWRHAGDRDSPTTTPTTAPVGSGGGARTTTRDTPAPATLAVVVRDARGPLANATVRIAPDDGEVIVVTTGGDGVASTTLAPGTYDVSASAAGHEPAAAPDQTLAAGETARIELALAAGGRTLSGQVTDVSGGPIAGARVDAAKLGGMAHPGAAIATALTGADGTYQITVAEGHLLVAARSADYAPQSRYVEVGAAGAKADFALVPGGVIEGIVLDDKTMQPVGGAIVGARRDTPMMMLAESGGHRATAGADGRFRLTGLRPGVYELDAAHAGLRSKADTVVGLGVAEQLTDVQILVGVGPVIRGKVVDETDAPVANARVTTFGRRTGGADARSDAQGAFVLEGLTPGSYVMIAAGDQHLPRGQATVQLADKDVTGVVVRVQRGFRVEGHVEPRQPCEIAVALDERRRELAMAVANGAVADARGAFELGPLLGGGGTLSARCASGDQGTLEVTFASGMPEIVVRVTPGGSIAGRIVDGDGKPVVGAAVMATRDSAEESMTIVNGIVTSGVQAVSGIDGAYEVRGLSPGTYRLGALDRGRPMRLRGKPPVVKLSAAEHETGVAVTVDRANGVIRGIVTGPDGKPLADAWVSVHQDLRSMLEGLEPARGDDGPGPKSRTVMVQATDDADGAGAGGGIPPVLTDDRGAFEITGLAHGTYDVLAEAQGGQLRGRLAGVKPDASVTIKALGVTSLSGTVRGPSGPPALFTVELEGPTQAQRSFTGGTFSLGRVDAGDYTVHVRSSDGNGSAKVKVLPDQPATVEIALVANAIVIGTVVDPGGKPVPDVPVAVIEDKGTGEMQIMMEGPPPRTGPDGKFRIEHAAGRGMLVVMAPGAITTRPGLALEAGKTLDVGAVQLEAGGPRHPPAP